MSDEQNIQLNSGDDAGTNESFLSGIENEELRANEMLQGYTSDEGGGLDKLASDFIEMKNGQPVIPESAEAYEFEAPEGMHEAMVQGYNDLKSFAHENNLPQETYNKLIEFDQARLAKITADMKQVTSESIDAMKAELGDKYDETHAKVDKLVKAVGGEELMNDFELGNNPKLFRVLAKLADSISEDSIILGGSGPQKNNNVGADGQKVIAYENM